MGGLQCLFYSVLLLSACSVNIQSDPNGINNPIDMRCNQFTAQ